MTTPPPPMSPPSTGIIVAADPLRCRLGPSRCADTPSGLPGSPASQRWCRPTSLAQPEARVSSHDPIPPRAMPPGGLIGAPPGSWPRATCAAAATACQSRRRRNRRQPATGPSGGHTPPTPGGGQTGGPPAGVTQIRRSGWHVLRTAAPGARSANGREGVEEVGSRTTRGRPPTASRPCVRPAQEPRQDRSQVRPSASIGEMGCAHSGGPWRCCHRCCAGATCPC